jgi:hypothetical protein
VCCCCGVRRRRDNISRVPEDRSVRMYPCPCARGCMRVPYTFIRVSVGGKKMERHQVFRSPPFPHYTRPALIILRFYYYSRPTSTLLHVQDLFFSSVHKFVHYERALTTYLPPSPNATRRVKLCTETIGGIMSSIIYVLY